MWDSLGNRVLRESTTSSTVSSLFFLGTRNELQRLKLLVHHHCLHTAATCSKHPSSCSHGTPKIGSFFPCYSAMRTYLVMSFQSSSALFVLFRTTTTVAFFALLASHGRLNTFEWQTKRSAGFISKTRSNTDHLGTHGAVDIASGPRKGYAQCAAVCGMLCALVAMES